MKKLGAPTKASHPSPALTGTLSPGERGGQRGIHASPSGGEGGAQTPGEGGTRFGTARATQIGTRTKPTKY